jgi:hypothetical protein
MVKNCINSSTQLWGYSVISIINHNIALSIKVMDLKANGKDLMQE